MNVLACACYDAYTYPVRSSKIILIRYSISPFYLSVRLNYSLRSCSSRKGTVVSSFRLGPLKHTLNFQEILGGAYDICRYFIQVDMSAVV